MDGDIAGYLDSASLALSGRAYVVDKRLKIQFNHEIGEAYATNNFEKFMTVYEKRIANFREDVAKFPVIFVIHLTTNQLPIFFDEILTRRSPHDDWQFLAINTSEDAFEMPAKLPERLHLAHVPYPSPEFVWHLAGDFATLEGYAFKRRIVAALRQVLVANFRRRS